MTALLQAIAFPPTGDTLWARRHEDARVYVAVRPICVALGLDWPSQYSRIKRTPVLAEGVSVMLTPSAGGDQKAVCLPLDLLPGWLFGVDVGRVKEQLRPKLIAYQRECFAVLWRHFNGACSVVADNDPIAILTDAANDDGLGGNDDDDEGGSDLAELPERTTALKLTMVREARLLGGRDAAKRLWRRLGLPELDEPAIIEAPLSVDTLSLFFAERLKAAPGVRTRADDIWRAYLAWAGTRSSDVVGRKTFGLALSRRFRPIKASVIWYRDVALRAESMG